jgi:hypothetical protein
MGRVLSSIWAVEEILSLVLDLLSVAVDGVHGASTDMWYIVVRS